MQFEKYKKIMSSNSYTKMFMDNWYWIAGSIAALLLVLYFMRDKPFIRPVSYAMKKPFTASFGSNDYGFSKEDYEKIKDLKYTEPMDTDNKSKLSADGSTLFKTIPALKDLIYQIETKT